MKTPRAPSSHYLIFNSLSQGVLVVEDGHIEYANPAFAAWRQRPLAEIANRDLATIFETSVATCFKLHAQRCLSEGRSDFDFEMPTQNGDSRSLCVTCTPDESKVLTRSVIAVIEDVTNLKNVEAQLRETDLRLSYSLAATGDGVWDWSISGGVFHHNQQWSTILGVDDGQSQHPIEKFAELIHVEDLELVQQRLQKCLSGASTFLSEHRMRKSDGEYIWVLDRGSVVERDAGGAPLRMVGSFRDVTDLRMRQVQLVQSSKMASLGEMAGGIAHEINNPLAIIAGKVSLIRHRLAREDFDRGKIDKDLSRIEVTVDRIAKTIRGLRAFSRNSTADPMAAASLSQIFEDALELCQEKFKNGSIEVKINCPAGVEIECRQSQLVQIITNLMSNSYDACQTLTERWVRIDATVMHDVATIAVTDSGYGIASHVAEKIMDPFFTTKELNQGTGLGLSISKGIAEQHSGQLYYDSASKHTRFIVRLPVKRSKSKAQAPAA